MNATTSSKSNSAPVRSKPCDGDPVSFRQIDARPSPKISGSGRRILLVDDDAIVRDSLNNVLTGEGYCVIPAENGQQALDVANTLPVDLALLDLNMPVKNGWDTFERLTTDHPTIPIIIITARPNQLFTAVGVGVVALLEKPMDIPTLLRTMEELLTETATQRLARLVGKHRNFHYQPGVPKAEQRLPPKLR